MGIAAPRSTGLHAAVRVSGWGWGEAKDTEAHKRPVLRFVLESIRNYRKKTQHCITLRAVMKWSLLTGFRNTVLLHSTPDMLKTAIGKETCS